MKKLNQNGNIMFMAMGFAALVALISIGILSTVGAAKKVKKTGVIFDYQAIQLILSQAAAVIENDQAWLATVQANPNMSCLLSNSAPCPMTEQVITLKNGFVSAAGGSSNLSTPGGSEGFDKNSLICNEYNSAGGHSKCVYAIRVSWQPDCVAPCVSVKSATNLFARSPKQRLKVDVVFNSNSDSRPAEISLLKTQSSFIRGQFSSSVQSFCNSIPGKVSAGGLVCQFNYNATDCLSGGGRMVDYVDVDGNVVCKRPAMFGNGTDNAKCDDGSAMVGVEGDTMICDVF